MAQLKSTIVQGNLTASGAILASKISLLNGDNDAILLGNGSTLSKSTLATLADYNILSGIANAAISSTNTSDQAIKSTLHINNHTDATKGGAYTLKIGSNSYEHLLIDGNEIIARDGSKSGSPVSTLYLNNEGGLVQIGNGGLQVGTGASNTSSNLLVTGNATINNDLLVNNNCTFKQDVSIPNGELTVGPSGITSGGIIHSSSTISSNTDFRLYGKDKDLFVYFQHSNNGATDDSGYDWRIGHLGSGEGNTNYFVIQSNTNTDTNTYINAMRIGLLNLEVGFNGHVYPLTDDAKTLGTSTYKWSNVYATTFTGNLTGTVTGNATTSSYPAGFSSRVASAPSWGTLTPANGYTYITGWQFDNTATDKTTSQIASADIVFAAKNHTSSSSSLGEVSVQIDGFFYQNEGGYRVLDSSGGTITGPLYISSSASLKFSGDSSGLGVKATYQYNTADDCMELIFS